MKAFLISFGFNLIFRYELLVLAVLSWLGNRFLMLPMLITYIILGLWISVSLVITVGLGVLSKGTPSPSFQKNVNPYSKTTKDYTEKMRNNGIDSGL